MKVGVFRPIYMLFVAFIVEERIEKVQFSGSGQWSVSPELIFIPGSVKISSVSFTTLELISLIFNAKVVFVFRFNM